VYEIIGRVLGEPERWRFPVPSSYDPAAREMDPVEAERFAAHFIRLEGPEEFAGVLMSDQSGHFPRHFGVVVNGNLIHGHLRAGIVRTPLARSGRFVIGYYRLRDDARDGSAAPDVDARTRSFARKARRVQATPSELTPSTIAAVRRLLPALPTVREWIVAVIAQHAGEARPVGALGFQNLGKYYPAELLGRARAVSVASIPIPPLARLGLSEFAALEMLPFTGMTYANTIFALPQRLTEELCFHELVHVVQWDTLGMDDFLLAYALGLLQFGYQQSPLERMAYTAQAHLACGQPPAASIAQMIERETRTLWERLSAALRQAGIAPGGAP
jgi:hypothetical protein